ncbi:FecR domain-containing protein [Chitinophaga sp. MM2321]|uniref:FecR family protein n=1 Tax=Chitinophaga sp. MM2321 TaxID=3137178 RepID=UPI0032D59E36
MDQLKDLIQRYLKGEATPEEAEVLNEWYHTFDDSAVELPLEPGEDRIQLEQRLLNRLKPVMQPVPLRARIYWWRYAVAAVLLIAAGGAIWLLRPASSPHNISIATQSPVKDIAPGNKKALLTLADGSTIALDDAANGALSRQGGSEVVKKEKGQLSYESGNATAEVVYNTLTTPRGGQFQVVLPDGTKVWLNSASSLRYPTSFPEGERKVVLTGQAYFDIAANARQPFKVVANEMEVNVLGTHFDVMAYPDEAMISTTLLEGKVRIQDKILSPGQQAILLHGSGELTIQDADINKTIAWKNGLFVFNKMDLPTILREIARWYDVEIVYSAPAGNELYGGGISRNLNLSAVLRVLEENGPNHFSIEGKKVVVLPR